MKWLVRISAFIVLVGLSFTLPVSKSNEYPYVGSNKCKKCHIKEHKSWAESNMAKSFELLKPGVRPEQSPFVDEDYVFDFETKKNEGAHEIVPLKYEH